MTFRIVVHPDGPLDRGMTFRVTLPLAVPCSPSRCGIAVSVLLALSCLLPSSARAAAFNVLGPERNGVAPAGVGLVDSIPEGGLPVLWTSPVLGHVGWDHNLGQVVVAEDGTAVVSVVGAASGETERRLICLNADGSIRWTVTRPEKVNNIKTHPNPVPCIEGGRVYALFNREVVCVELASGAEQWSASGTLVYLKSSPLVVDGVVVARINDGFGAWDAEDGEPLWQYITDFDGSGGGWPIPWHTAKGTYVIGKSDEDHEIVCLEPRTGRVVWQVELPSQDARRQYEVGPVLNENWLWVSRVNSAGTDVVFRMDPGDPETPPQRVLVGSFQLKAAGVIHQGDFYYGFGRRANFRTLSMDLRNGQAHWRYETGNNNATNDLEPTYKGYGDAILADGKVWGVMNKKVAFFFPETEDLNFGGKSQALNSSDVSSLAVSPDGRMYVLCGNHVDSTATVVCLDVRAPVGSIPRITQRTLPTARAGQPYDARLWVSGGNGLRQWRILSGSLPEGLTLDGATHRIHGVAQATGSFSLALEVTDADGDTDVVELTLIVNEAGSIAAALRLDPVLETSALAFDTRADRFYNIQYRHSMNAGDWTDAPHAIAGTGEVIERLICDAHAVLFVRVVETLDPHSDLELEASALDSALVLLER